MKNLLSHPSNQKLGMRHPSAHLKPLLLILLSVSLSSSALGQIELLPGAGKNELLPGAGKNEAQPQATDPAAAAAGTEPSAAAALPTPQPEASPNPANAILEQDPAINAPAGTPPPQVPKEVAPDANPDAPTGADPNAANEGRNGNGGGAQRRKKAAALAAPTPSKAQEPQKFVPSEVEAYLPNKNGQGDPRAILHTSMGDIVLRLYADRAPQTVRNFIDLARGDKDSVDPKTGRSLRKPFYTNLTFHRVIPGSLIQTGCPFGTGRGGPGFTIHDEINPTLNFDEAGMVAMAPQRDHAKPTTSLKETNGSQFFITLQPQKEWTGKYTIFGVVEKGLTTVRKISEVKTGPTDRPIRKVFLNQIEIIDQATAEVIKKNSK